MTKDQRVFIHEIKTKRHEPDYAGAMFPIHEDPKGEVRQAMYDIAKATGMKFRVTQHFISLLNRKVNPVNN